MPRRLWNDGQEIIENDLSAASPVLEMELYDRLIYELMGRQQNCLFRDSLKASFVNATTSQVKAGNGVYYDAAQVSPEPKTRLFMVATNTNVVHTAADGTNSRIDIIVAKAERDVTVTESRNFKDALTSVISLQSLDVQTDWVSELLVVAGVPSGSPAVPATPAGYIKLAEVLVTAVTGISGSAAYTDKRTIFDRASSSRETKLLVFGDSPYTVVPEDEVIAGNAVGGVIQVLFPLAAESEGRMIGVVKTDASANAVTPTRQGSDLINGETTQAQDTQYTLLWYIAINGSWYIA